MADVTTSEAVAQDGRFWLCVHQPRCVPRRGGPFRTNDMAKVLREWMTANPQALITVVTLADNGPWFEHGPEALEIIDRRSAPRARKHNERQDEAFVRGPAPRWRSSWHEDDGEVLWWKFPIVEPPYVGSPVAEDWPGYHTHWTPIIVPVLPARSGRRSSKREVKS